MEWSTHTVREIHLLTLSLPLSPSLSLSLSISLPPCLPFPLSLVLATSLSLSPSLFKRLSLPPFLPLSLSLPPSPSLSTVELGIKPEAPQAKGQNLTIYKESFEERFLVVLLCSGECLISGA